MPSMKVLVLHTSAFHLGFLGCYGNTWIETPHLDRLAAEAVVFDQHHADCPGVRTCWTGRYGQAPPEQTLPALLKAAGITMRVIDAEGAEQEADATLLETTLDATMAALEDLANEEP